MPAIPDLTDSDPDLKSVDRPLRGPGATTRKMLCATCDIACNVVAEIKDERVVRIRSSDNPAFRANICMKGVAAPKGFANPNRIMYPLKRVGERGSGNWERVTWDEAMADIGARLPETQGCPRRRNRAARQLHDRREDLARPLGKIVPYSGLGAYS